jgi:hypothetical protein
MMVQFKDNDLHIISSEILNVCLKFDLYCYIKVTSDNNFMYTITDGFKTFKGTIVKIDPDNLNNLSIKRGNKKILVYSDYFCCISKLFANITDNYTEYFCNHKEYIKDEIMSEFI